MSRKKETGEFSRRSFIKGVGAGLVGSCVLPQTIKGAGQSLPSGDDAPDSGDKVKLALEVNGKSVSALIEPRTTLAQVLRDELQLTGTKIACNHGECGACTVLLDGKAVYSCHMLALDAVDRKVQTIEGLLEGEKLHPIQEAFVEHDGFQCGFCTPGQIMSAQALLNEHPRPTREQVLQGMSGNICRCAAYPHIIESVLAAADNLNR